MQLAFLFWQSTSAVFHFILLTSDQTMYHNVTFQSGVDGAFFCFVVVVGCCCFPLWQSTVFHLILLSSDQTMYHNVTFQPSVADFYFFCVTKYSVSLNSAHVTSNNVAWSCISVKCNWRFCTIKVLCFADHLIPLTSHQTVSHAALRTTYIWLFRFDKKKNLVSLPITSDQSIPLYFHF